MHSLETRCALYVFVVGSTRNRFQLTDAASMGAINKWQWKVFHYHKIDPLMHFFLTITHPNEETAGDQQRMLLIVQEGSLIATANTGSQVAQKVRPTPTFCLVLQALLTPPKLLLQLHEVEFTY